MVIPKPLTPRFVGALRDLSPSDRKLIVDRANAAGDTRIEERVRGILARVRAEGDRAIVALTKEIDGIDLDAIEVPKSAWDRALEELPSDVRLALERATKNIERVHRAFLPKPMEVETEPGVIVGRRPDPLAAVGVYAPGGRAAYPSSVLMGVVPARAAGVPEIVVCSPPQADGLPSKVVLAAAAIAGATRMFAIGGAQAVAALAFGTASVPKVDRIVGPGNAYVAEAKRAVAGSVGIDSPAGPSEILVIADSDADPGCIVRELLAQAEHDPAASVVAVLQGKSSADKVLALLAQASPAKRDIIESSLSSRGAVLWVDDLEPAVAFIAEYAPEHLLLAVNDPESLLARSKHAGTVFLGEAASVAFGDYMTGANHVLPTAGYARSMSGLSSLDFIRWTTWQSVSPRAAAAMSADVVVLATAEGLPSHAAAAQALTDPSTSAGRTRTGKRTSAVDLPRHAYAEMGLYAPNRKPCAIDLSDNTNLVGLPPSARKALEEAASKTFTRYPSVYGEDLKRALADYVGVAPEEIVTGCGSDDILDSAIRAFTEPGDRLAYPDPTFSMLPSFAKMNSLEERAISLLGPHYDADPERFVAARARVTYLCSPNNPTGTMTSSESLDAILSGVPGIVIADEAYIEYAERESLARRATSEERLLVVRTLSKAFGMAGMRVGYAVGSRDLVAAVEKSRGPYKVSGLAESMAVAALSNDRDWVRACIADVLESRQKMSAFFQGLGLEPIPSSANFLLVPIARESRGTRSKDAKHLAAKLVERGIGVRPFPGAHAIGDALRVSVGPWSIMKDTLAAFEEVLS